MAATGEFRTNKVTVMNASAFPTLDLLGQHGLRLAYLILMLGARSGGHLQRLHDEVIPLDCRLPRSLFIQLKHERKRMLETGGEEQDKFFRVSPSDEVLLQEFNRARRDPHEFKPATFRKYYEDLLRAHSKNTNLPAGDLGNHGLLVRWNDGDWDDWANGKLANIPISFSITIVLQSMEVDPPEGVLLPAEVSGTFSRTTKAVFLYVHIDKSEINHLGTEALLTLPPWDCINIEDRSSCLIYQLPYPDAIELGEPNEHGAIWIDEPTLAEFLAFLAEHGLPIELTARTAAS